MRFKYFSILLIFCFLGLLNTSSLAIAAKKKPSYKIGQLDFRSITVGDALKILSEHSELNIIASQQAARLKITMYLKDITALDVIDAIAKTYNLWYKHDKRTNIIRIYTVKEYRMEQVEFKPEKTEIFTLKNAKNAIDLADTVCNLYGSERVILSFGSNENELLNDLSSRLSRFDLINGATGSQTTSASTSSNSSNNNSNNNNSSSGSNCIQDSNSGGSNNNQSNNNRNNNQNSNSDDNNSASINHNSLDSISAILNDINSKNTDLQNILSGNSGQSNAFLTRAIRHQAPIYVSVIKRQNRVLVRSRDIEAMKQITALYKEIDTESSMLLMEVKILSIDLSDGYDSLFNFKIKSNDLAVTGGQDAVSALGQSLVTAASAFNPALLATVVSDKFETRLQLLEQENRVTEVATPILLTTNQEVSRVFIGDERPIVTGYEDSTTTTTGTGSSTVVSNSIIVPITEIRNLGTTLFLTPNINSDRTVSIRILIERSGLSATKATIPVQVGSSLVDADIDVVQTETFTGTVVAKDGTSIAIGGFIKEVAKDGETKVPILGDIPGLGFFFRDKTKLRERTELVVIIRPFITTTPNEASLVSNRFIDRNSIHPNAAKVDNMNIYSNKDKRHKGYQLDKPFKEYDLQDKFDRFHDKGDRTRYKKPVSSISPTSKQQSYVELTKYAAKSVRLAVNKRELVAGINSVKLSNIRSADLLYDSRIKVIPVASWRKGGVHVTALALYNLSKSTVKVDFKHIKGKWLASSIESAKLTKQGDFGDSTYLYVISAGSFEDIAKRIKLANR
ncbi:MAG: DUF3438 family protein [Methylomarinum sp.]|nr:DUF3438 family protein [Methylomarinum sp.]